MTTFEPGVEPPKTLAFRLNGRHTAWGGGCGRVRFNRIHPPTRKFTEAAAERAGNTSACLNLCLLFFFITLGLEMIDTKDYEP